MSDPTRPTGLLLVAGGVLWFVIATTELGGTVVVPGVGVAFLIAYLATRSYGLLIPAGILCHSGSALLPSPSSTRCWETAMWPGGR